MPVAAATAQVVAPGGHCRPALLPYGYRASYTATTWSDTAASEQRFRVVFAHRARDEASRVTWRAAARVPDRRARSHLP